MSEQEQQQQQQPQQKGKKRKIVVSFEEALHEYNVRSSWRGKW